jgi:hypothetical protein
VRALAAVPLSILLLLPATASAAPAPLTGVGCGTSYADDPATPGGSVGELDGGPLVLVADDPAVPVRGSVTCTLQTGATHGGAPLAAATSATTTGVVVLPATPVAFTADPLDTVYLCTRVDVEGGAVWYSDEEAGEWSTDPDVPCAPLGVDEVCPTADPTARCSPWSPVLIDSITCPILALVFPPWGDVPDVWDCPPYGG